MMVMENKSNHHLAGSSPDPKIPSSMSSTPVQPQKCSDRTCPRYATVRCKYCLTHCQLFHGGIHP